MTDQSVIVNPEALEPLFAPWKEPTLHRVRAKREGEPAEQARGRRPRAIPTPQNPPPGWAQAPPSPPRGARHSPRPSLFRCGGNGGHVVASEDGVDAVHVYPRCALSAMEER